jgi:DNA polymerase III epsilon subunit-like protein
MKNLIFVDCEAYGHCPALGKLTEFGAVAYPSKATFHGILALSEPSKENPAIPALTGKIFDEKEVFEKFESWILEQTRGARPIFVSDNPAF